MQRQVEQARVHGCGRNGVAADGARQCLHASRQANLRYLIEVCAQSFPWHIYFPKQSET